MTEFITSKLNNILDIKHAFYINLESRPDRKQHVEEQLNQIGIHAERFDAIKMDNGAIGCSLSHLKCLEIAKENNWDHVLIVEDDILFLEPTVFINQTNKFLNTHDDWDVLLLAGNNHLPFQPIDDTCIKVSKCQTTTGYIVKNHYFDTLIENIREGINKFKKEPYIHWLYAIDVYWFSLQQRDRWFLIIPLTVIQKEGYSDLAGKIISYKEFMLNLE